MPSLSDYADKLDKPLDTRYLRRVNVVDFLEALDIPNITMAKSDEVRFSCPFDGHGGGDETPSAYMNTGEKNAKKATRWFCHGCKRKGNAVTFLSEHMHISRTVAASWIKDHWAPGFDKPVGGIDKEFTDRRERYESERTKVVDEIPILSWEMYFQTFGVGWSWYAANAGDKPEVAYMFNRGFNPSDLEEWAVGYDSISQRITIPVCDPQGNLVGIKGRAWDPTRKIKYLALGDTTKTRARNDGDVYGFEPYDKSRVVFGIEKFGKRKTYVMDEGEINVMSFERMGIPAFSIAGSYLSIEQAQIVREYADEVILFLDTNAAGNVGIWGRDDIEDDDDESYRGAVAMLEQFVRVKIAPSHLLDANVLWRTGRHSTIHKLLRDARPSFAVRRGGQDV